MFLMAKRKSKIRLLFLIILVIFLVVGGGIYRIFLRPMELARNILEEASSRELITKVATELHSTWRFADLDVLEYEKSSECMGITPDQLKMIDKSYFQCNPEFFLCYLKIKKNIFTTSGTQKIKFKILDYKNSSQSNKEIAVTSPLIDGLAYGIKFKLSDTEEKHSKTFHFEDSCSNVYLPERIYAQGAVENAGTEKDFRFDNFNQAIYLDKFLVTFRDIKEWMENDPLASTSIARPNQKDWPNPAHHLTFKEMQRFCSFRGKHIMESQFYDALSFYPPSLEDPFPIANSRGPYPWTKKFKDSFLFMAMHDPKFELQASFCRQVYTKECKELETMKSHDRGHVTWSGGFQVLGGPLEAMRNVVAPNENIKVSSYYFFAKSPWHQLGRRAEWDGFAFSDKNINWGDKIKTEIEESDYNIGFRCMKKGPIFFEIGKNK